MRNGRALSLAMQDLKEIPDCVFQEALEAEVTTVDFSKNKLKEVPAGLVGVFLMIFGGSNVCHMCKL